MSEPTPSRNPWPIVIVGYFVVFISFLVGFIVFATRQHVDLVRPDYYEEEIRYQQQLDRLQRTQRAGECAVVAYDAKQSCITVSFPKSSGRQPTGRIYLYRPSDAKLDQEMPLALDSAGRQRVDANALQSGLWKVRVQWLVDGQDYYLDQPVVVRKNSVL